MAYTKLGWSITSTAPYQGNNIFRDSNGYIHVVGFEHVSSGAELYYAISIDDGITFTDGEGGGSGTYKILATADPNNTYGSPAVLVDSSDNIYVFWADVYLYFIKKTGGSGGTWGSATNISGGWVVEKSVRAEIDSEDNLIITGYNGNTLVLHTSIDGGSNWIQSDSEFIAITVYQTDLCIDSNEDLWQITQTIAGSDNVYVNKIPKTEDTPDTWAIDSEILLYNGAQYSSKCISIVSERATGIVWAFMVKYDNPNYIVQYKKYSGGSWDTNWTQIYSSTNYYFRMQGISTYDNQIYLYLTKFSSPYDLYYLRYDGSNWSSSPQSVGLTDARFNAIEQPNLSSGISHIYSLVGASSGAPSGIGAYFTSLQLPLEIIDSDTITLSDEILLNIPQENLNLTDTLNLSDNIYLKLSAEEFIEEDTITLNDEIKVAFPLFEEDTINLSDEIYINTPQEQIILNDIINLSDSILDWKDIINDFRMMIGTTEDIPSDFRSVVESINDMPNAFSMAYAGDLEDIESDIRYVIEPTYDITNDFRMLKSWQVPGEAGFQSLGKEYIKIYINGSSDEDVDINSVTIHKALNSAHTANFVIGRPYDTANKPTIEHEVEIRYYEKNWVNYCLLYKGYIAQINPGDDPDSLKVNCQDKYWIRNREKKYFYVGHKPSDNQELYYETIASGLSACGFNGTDIGDFVPQTMNLFGRGESNSIDSLITNAGNYAWFYDVDGTKKLWTADRGSIVNLERQELNKNIGLYQVLKHSFTESIENLVNRFRVTMGDKIIRRFNSYGGSKEYDGYYYYLDLDLKLTHGWNEEYEVLARNSSIENDNEVKQGFDKHSTEYNSQFANVYTKYIIPFTLPELEAYTDRFEPRISIEAPVGGSNLKCSIGINRGLGSDPNDPDSGQILRTTITGGYTVDYENRTITFGERVYLYTEDKNDEINSIRAPIIRLSIWKQKFISRTDDPTDDPQDSGDITSPLVFITDKMGDYAETIWDLLQLSGLGIQYGGWYISGYDEDNEAIWQYVPSWDDTAFAKDIAEWKLSQNSDKKVQGTIDLTIDTMCHYGIDLAKRIMIDGVLENSLNINSITYNLNSFTVTLSLENARYYKRDVSIQPRGV